MATSFECFKEISLIMGNYYQSVYNVENVDKYVGSVDTKTWRLTTQFPHCRSSWEHKVAYWCDHNVNVLKWGFECVLIPYVGMDNKRHKYIVDFYVELKQRNGNVSKQLWEVKPLKDGPIIINGSFNYSNKPKPPKTRHKKAMKNYMYAMKQYITNCKKWQAVESFCKTRGMKFKVITEKDLIV